MIRKILILLLMFGFVGTFNLSCSSSGEGGDEQEIEASDTEAEADNELAEEEDGDFEDESAEGEEDFAEDGEDTEGGELSEEDGEFADEEEGEFADSDAEGEEGEGVDEDLSVEADELAQTDEAVGKAEGAEDVAVDEGGFESVDESSGSDENADAGDSSFGQDGAGKVAAGKVAEMSTSFGSSDSAFSDNSIEEPEKTWVPVKKIRSAAFNKAGQLLNTVYIIRPGDTLGSVSTKIYGDDRSADILAANPHLNRSFTTGDKLYYNSPNRPNDSAQLLTYYEDNGRAPSTYDAQAGENIRELAQNLLGNPSSWKEIWATNPDVESKGILDGPTTLTYFTDDGTETAQSIAMNETAPPMQDLPPEPNLPPPDNLPPPTLPEPQANNEMPQPPDMAAAGTVEPPLPPPPPAMEPPMPPPQMANNLNKHKKKRKKKAGSKLPLYGGLALLVAGLVGILVMRKKKTKAINMSETQI